MEDLERSEVKQKNNKKSKKFKKALKWLFIFLFVVLLGGVSGIFADRFLFSYLASTDLLEKYPFLKPKETEIIVQKTETVQIEENIVMSEVVNRVKSSVVAIAKIDKKNIQPQHYGSGFIVTSDGLIATNNKVIDNNKDKYLVFTNNNKSYEAQVIHIDSASNLIFLKIKADNLPVVSLGVSDDLKIGQRMVTLGYSALDFKNYANFGTINSIDASIYKDNNEQIDDYVITDNEINMINSGGPLVDMSGRVVGINIKGGDNVKDYVLPIDEIKVPLDDIISINKIKRLKLGIKYTEVTPYIVDEQGLEKGYGLYLANKDCVVKNGPADKAGLKKGDLIYAVNSTVLDENNNIVHVLKEYKLGDEVIIKFVRDNQEMETSLKLGE